MAARTLDSRTLLTVGALVALGLATLYSAGQTDVPTEIADIWRKQLGWIALGTVVGVAVYRVSPVAGKLTVTGVAPGVQVKPSPDQPGLQVQV